MALALLSSLSDLNDAYKTIIFCIKTGARFSFVGY